jgi:hypothetical protein
MFDYPLATIATDLRAMGWVERYGYEKLQALLRNMGYLK